MSDGKRDLEERGLRELMRGVARDGVASLRFPDGQMFMFTLEKLRELLKQVEDGGHKELLLFVGAGPDVRDIQEN